MTNRFAGGDLTRAHAKLIHDEPAAKKLPWQTMARDPEVYAKGKVRHSDHKTILLPFWHRVVVNEETRSRNVAFLD